MKNKKEIKNLVIEKLKKCLDPEIPVDLWSLGLIYKINIDNKNSACEIDILMSLTTPGCTMGEVMAQDIKKKIKDITNVKKVNVKITFDPPWQPSMMNNYAKKKLGFTKVKSKPKQTNLNWE